MAVDCKRARFRNVKDTKKYGFKRRIGLPFIGRTVVELKIDFEKAAGLVEIIGISYAVIESDFEAFPPDFHQLIDAGVYFVKEQIIAFRGIK